MPATRSEKGEVDEDWYFKTNPDVYEAMVRGRIRSAHEHYLVHGQFESRSPVPPALPESNRVFVFGAFGTNNVGDEAIFQALRLEFPDLIQVFVQRPTYSCAMSLLQMLNYDQVFQPDSRLILGGGGLLYHKQHVLDMLALAERAKARGARVDLLGIGCEGAEASYFAEIRQLFALAETVTVRTQTSVEIIEGITGRRVGRQDDFAFKLHPHLPLRWEPRRAIPHIGIVTDGDIRADYSDLAAAIARRLRGRPDQRATFVHIPHVRAFANQYNNDVVVGNALWSEIYSHGVSDDEGFRLQPFTNNPYEVLQTYAKLDGIIATRFHALVFAHLMGLPTLVLAGDGAKSRAFIRDYDNPRLFVAVPGMPLEPLFERFYADLQQAT